MKKILLTILAVLAMSGMAMAQTAPADVNLHRNEDGTWSFTMPGRNLVMSTETFSTNDTVNGHYLAGVPEGWLILALGDTVPVSNDSLRRTTPITEGTPVTIVPTGNLRRIKSITLVDESTPVESITLNKTATTISAGNTETLSVSSVTPDDATDQTVTWSSDNEAVATVDADGKVTAVALGTANITATANDGSGVTATCAVTVSKVVTINQSDWGSDWTPSFTKDGVTVSAGMIDPMDGNLMDGGTFSTTLGNFTKIVVTATSCHASGTGWSGSHSSMTWAGTPASTVSFSGEFMGMGMTQTTIVCTIVPTN